MKVYKTLLHIWIATASVAAFFLGWIGLAHSPKPIQPQSAASTNTTTSLDPLPAMPSLGQIQQGSASVSTFRASSQTFAARPVFRSRGS
jgi:hypothetical protein